MVKTVYMIGLKCKSDESGDDPDYKVMKTLATSTRTTNLHRGQVWTKIMVIMKVGVWQVKIFGGCSGSESKKPYQCRIEASEERKV